MRPSAAPRRVLGEGGRAALVHRGGARGGDRAGSATSPSRDARCPPRRRRRATRAAATVELRLLVGEGRAPELERAHRRPRATAPRRRRRCRARARRRRAPPPRKRWRKAARRAPGRRRSRPRARRAARRTRRRRPAASSACAAAAAISRGGRERRGGDRGAHGGLVGQPPEPAPQQRAAAAGGGSSRRRSGAPPAPCAAVATWRAAARRAARLRNSPSSSGVSLRPPAVLHRQQAHLGRRERRWPLAHAQRAGQRAHEGDERAVALGYRAEQPVRVLHIWPISAASPSTRSERVVREVREPLGLVELGRADVGAERECRALGCVERATARGGERRSAPICDFWNSKFFARIISAAAMRGLARGGRSSSQIAGVRCAQACSGRLAASVPSPSTRRRRSKGAARAAMISGAARQWG